MAEGKAAIYKKSDDSIVCSSDVTVCYEGTSWRTFTGFGPSSLSAGEDYYLMVWGNIGAMETCLLRFTSTTSTSGAIDPETYGAVWPSTLDKTDKDSYYSIYANYTSTGGGTTQFGFQGTGTLRMGGDDMSGRLTIKGN